MQKTSQALTRDLSVDQLTNTCSRIVIDDVQNAKVPTINKLITHQVESPTLVQSSWQRHGHSGSNQLFALLGPYLQT